MNKKSVWLLAGLGLVLLALGLGPRFWSHVNPGLEENSAVVKKAGPVHVTGMNTHSFTLAPQTITAAAQSVMDTMDSKSMGLPASTLTYISNQIKSDLAGTKAASSVITGAADISAAGWSNPALAPADENSIKYPFKGEGANAGLTGSIEYSLSYAVSGAAVLNNETSHGATISGAIVPQISVLVTFFSGAGDLMSVRGSTNGDPFEADIDLKANTSK